VKAKTQSLAGMAVLGILLVAGGALPGKSVAAIDVTASVSISNMYLWRGLDLGTTVGPAAVAGDLVASNEGSYAGIWGSSGEASLGAEYDLYIGYGRMFGGFGFDISAWTYVYPDVSSTSSNSDLENPGELSEIILDLFYAWEDVSAGIGGSFYQNIAGAAGYQYMTLSGDYQWFSILVGYTSQDGPDYTHVDISYAYNKNLHFTVSQVVQQDSGQVSGVEYDSYYSERPKFVVVYVLPIKIM